MEEIGNLKLKKLELLITIVPKGKKEVIIDLLEQFDVTAQASILGSGTVKKIANDDLYYFEKDKDIIFSIIREDMVKDAILRLEVKFVKFKSNQCSTFSVKLSSVIGVSNYLLFSNMGGKEKWVQTIWI